MICYDIVNKMLYFRWILEFKFRNFLMVQNPSQQDFRKFFLYLVKHLRHDFLIQMYVAYYMLTRMMTDFGAKKSSRITPFC